MRPEFHIRARGRGYAVCCGVELGDEVVREEVGDDDVAVGAEGGELFGSHYGLLRVMWSCCGGEESGRKLGVYYMRGVAEMVGWFGTGCTDATRALCTRNAMALLGQC